MVSQLAFDGLFIKGCIIHEGCHGCPAVSVQASPIKRNAMLCGFVSDAFIKPYYSLICSRSLFFCSCPLYQVSTFFVVAFKDCGQLGDNNDNLTQSYGITPSMSRRGNPFDNAMAENFFSILKTECLYRHKPASFKEANALIDSFILFYNHERIQSKTGVAPLSLRHSF